MVFPQDFYCYDDFDDIPNEVVNQMINNLLQKAKDNPQMSVLIDKLGNTEVIIFKQYRADIDNMAYRIIVMKNHYEYIVELDNEETLTFINKEEAENSEVIKKGCLGCN